MASIDIRNTGKDEITEITFADPTEENVYTLSRGQYGVCIEDPNLAMGIASKEDAQNLIKALEKAIELGWWKE